MLKKVLFTVRVIGSFFFFLCLFWSCARPVAPTGGPKDEMPPRIDSLKSTPNLQTNFRPKTLELSFNEWVVLKDQTNQVLISPPLERKPSVSLRGKTVKVEFPENTSFRDNTTYTLNFGTAVQDLTEGNPAKDLRFVFSTGPFLDSLRFQGSVADAQTGQAVKKVSVLLYPADQADSIVRRGLPYYYAFSDENGYFFLENLAAGTYRIVAIEESASNLKWDGPTERIAFGEKNIQIPTDTTSKLIKLRLSKDGGKLQNMGNSDPHPGLSVAAYSANPAGLLPPISLSGGELLPIISGDSVYVFYKNTPDSTWYFTLGTDSVRVRPGTREAFFTENSLTFPKPPSATGAAKGRKNSRAPGATPNNSNTIETLNFSQHPTESAAIPFGRPLVSVDTTRCVFQADSTTIPILTINVDTTDERRLRLTTNWRPGATHTLDFLPGAVTDWFGEKNRDTLRARFLVQDQALMSSLELTLKETKAETAYLVELLPEGGNVAPIRTIWAKSDTTASLSMNFNAIPAAAYTLRITEDSNQNRRWDGARFEEKRQPERVFLEKVKGLKPNWEVKLEVSAQ